MQLTGQAIDASPQGQKKPLANATLVAWSSTESMKQVNIDAERTYRVAHDISAETLRVSGKRLLEDCRAVLLINGTPTMDPPSFDAMFEDPANITEMGQLFGTLEGCIVKHMVHGCWEAPRAGGVYFFTSEELIDKYLASELWCKIVRDTPWQDVTYEKYAAALM